MMIVNDFHFYKITYLIGTHHINEAYLQKSFENIIQKNQIVIVLHKMSAIIYSLHKKKGQDISYYYYL